MDSSKMRTFYALDFVVSGACGRSECGFFHIMSLV